MQEQKPADTPPAATTKRLVFGGPNREGAALLAPKNDQVPIPQNEVQDPDVTTSDNKPQTAHSSSELDDMSVEDLQRQQEEIDQKIREKKKAEKLAVIEQIVNVVHTYDIPIDELVDALGGLKIKRKGVKAVQKFRDPVTGVTWSGRGKEPAWIRGKDRKKFKIPE